MKALKIGVVANAVVLIISLGAYVYPRVRAVALPQAAKQAKPQTQYIQAYTLPVCTDSNNKVIPCGEAKPSLPPMVAPTKRDVVTHLTELGCPAGYKEGNLTDGVDAAGNVKYLLVCITPAFIAQLRKAAR